MKPHARKVRTVEIEDGAFGALLPKDCTDPLQLALEDKKTNTRWVFCLPREWRIDLAMTLLGADGAQVNVKLNYPTGKKRRSTP